MRGSNATERKRKKENKVGKRMQHGKFFFIPTLHPKQATGPTITTPTTMSPLLLVLGTAALFMSSTEAKAVTLGVYPLPLAKSMLNVPNNNHLLVFPEELTGFRTSSLPVMAKRDAGNHNNNDKALMTEKRDPTLLLDKIMYALKRAVEDGKGDKLGDEVMSKKNGLDGVGVLNSNDIVAYEGVSEKYLLHFK